MGQPVDWWANLLQGAISSVIGGIVAALTAWYVVQATIRHERALTETSAARESAHTFIRLTHRAAKLMCTPFQPPPDYGELGTVLSEWLLETSLLIMAIAKHNPNLTRQLDEVRDVVATAFNQASYGSDYTVSQNFRIREHASDAMMVVSNNVANWVAFERGTINPLPQPPRIFDDDE
ncbi:hypothetical protein ACIBHY_00095 [Nonomuraea sp. NPDC050547]|uniref:hypothetical protein n=1 Tax=Nonomuraea sp. NPDC050547 TaxID=3364368 RepID=UPI00378E90F5